jgi:hypothetical protein
MLGIRPVGREILPGGKGYEVGLDLIVQSAQSALKTPSTLGKEGQDSAFISAEGTQALFRPDERSDGRSAADEVQRFHVIGSVLAVSHAQ